jgi:FkbM family methyltransferase
MKSMLVGTTVGAFGLRARDALALLRAACFRPETVGTVANDQLATHLVSRLCQPGKGFIDVGAHIGSVSAEVISHDASIKIYAIEPMPEKAQNLRRRFPMIELHECALGESEGEVPFFVNLRQSGFSSLVKPDDIQNSIEIRVHIQRLDALINSDRIDVIKIDVEGAELGVVRGGEGLITRNRPTIMFESAPQINGPSDERRAILRWFDDRNFDVVLPNRVAHHGPGLTLDGFVEAHFYPIRTTNYFAIPRERRAEIRGRARAALGMEPPSLAA